MTGKTTDAMRESEENSPVLEQDPSPPRGESPYQANIDEEILQFKRATEEIKEDIFDPLFNALVAELSNALAYNAEVLSRMSSLRDQAHELENESRALLESVEERLGLLVGHIDQPLPDGEP